MSSPTSISSTRSRPHSSRLHRTATSTKKNELERAEKVEIASPAESVDWKTHSTGPGSVNCISALIDKLDQLEKRTRSANAQMQLDRQATSRLQTSVETHGHLSDNMAKLSSRMGGKVQAIERLHKTLQEVQTVEEMIQMELSATRIQLTSRMKQVKQLLKDKSSLVAAENGHSVITRSDDADHDEGSGVRGDIYAQLLTASAAIDKLLLEKHDQSQAIKERDTQIQVLLQEREARDSRNASRSDTVNQRVEGLISRNTELSNELEIARKELISRSEQMEKLTTRADRAQRAADLAKQALQRKGANGDGSRSSILEDSLRQAEQELKETQDAAEDDRIGWAREKEEAKDRYEAQLAWLRQELESSKQQLAQAELGSEQANEKQSVHRHQKQDEKHSLSLQEGQNVQVGHASMSNLAEAFRTFDLAEATPIDVVLETAVSVVADMRRKEAGMLQDHTKRMAGNERMAGLYSSSLKRIDELEQTLSERDEKQKILVSQLEDSLHEVEQQVSALRKENEELRSSQFGERRMSIAPECSYAFSASPSSITVQLEALLKRSETDKFLAQHLHELGVLQGKPETENGNGVDSNSDHGSEFEEETETNQDGPPKQPQQLQDRVGFVERSEFDKVVAENKAMSLRLKSDAVAQVEDGTPLEMKPNVSSTAVVPTSSCKAIRVASEALQATVPLLRASIVNMFSEASSDLERVSQIITRVVCSRSKLTETSRDGIVVPVHSASPMPNDSVICSSCAAPKDDLSLSAQLMQQYHGEEKQRVPIRRAFEEHSGCIRSLLRIRPRLSETKVGEHQRRHRYAPLDVSLDASSFYRQQSRSIQHNGSRVIPHGDEDVVFLPHGSDSHVVLSGDYGHDKLYEFEKVFAGNSCTLDMFEHIRSDINSVGDGKNVCVLAYGQTGSGKTFTMDDLIAMSASRLFELVDQRSKARSYEIGFSVVEVAAGGIRDLLSSVRRKERGSELEDASCEVKRDAYLGHTYVSNVRIAAVRVKEDVMKLLHTAQRRRTCGETSRNTNSSRSHVVTRIFVHGEDAASSELFLGKLTLVDLAGSERLSREAPGPRVKETQFINRSLGALSNVLEAIDTFTPHIPYRDSQLTFLLEDALTSTGRVIVISHVSPLAADQSETQHTIDFTQRIHHRQPRVIPLVDPQHSVTTAAHAADSSWLDHHPTSQTTGGVVRTAGTPRKSPPKVAGSRGSRRARDSSQPRCRSRSASRSSSRREQQQHGSANDSFTGLGSRLRPPSPRASPYVPVVSVFSVSPLRKSRAPATVRW